MYSASHHHFLPTPCRTDLHTHHLSSQKAQRSHPAIVFVGARSCTCTLQVPSLKCLWPLSSVVSQPAPAPQPDHIRCQDFGSIPCPASVVLACVLYIACTAAAVCSSATRGTYNRRPQTSSQAPTHPSLHPPSHRCWVHFPLVIQQHAWDILGPSERDQTQHPGHVQAASRTIGWRSLVAVVTIHRLSTVEHRCQALPTGLPRPDLRVKLQNLNPRIPVPPSGVQPQPSAAQRLHRQPHHREQQPGPGQG